MGDNMSYLGWFPCIEYNSDIHYVLSIDDGIKRPNERIHENKEDI